MFKKISDFFMGDPNKKQIQELVKVVDKINALEPNFEKLTDEELKAKTPEYRKRLADGESLDELLPEALRPLGSQQARSWSAAL